MLLVDRPADARLADRTADAFEIGLGDTELHAYRLARQDVDDLGGRHARVHDGENGEQRLGHGKRGARVAVDDAKRQVTRVLPVDAEDRVDDWRVAVEIWAEDEDVAWSARSGPRQEQRGAGRGGPRIRAWGCGRSGPRGNDLLEVVSRWRATVRLAGRAAGLRAGSSRQGRRGAWTCRGQRVDGNARAEGVDDGLRDGRKSAEREEDEAVREAVFGDGGEAAVDAGRQVHRAVPGDERAEEDGLPLRVGTGLPGEDHVGSMKNVRVEDAGNARRQGEAFRAVGVVGEVTLKLGEDGIREVCRKGCGDAPGQGAGAERVVRVDVGVAVLGEILEPDTRRDECRIGEDAMALRELEREPGAKSGGRDEHGLPCKRRGQRRLVDDACKRVDQPFELVRDVDMHKAPLS